MRPALLALMLLGACANPSAVAPRASAPQAPPPVEGAWAFTTGPICQAQIGQRGLSLTIRAGPGPTVTFQPLPGGGIQFAGAGGQWRLPAREVGPGAAQPLDRAGPRVQALLRGGMIILPGGRRLRAPDAGVAGRDWYGCLTGLGDPG